ncbi:MAG TPA: hypothetical protein ENK19_08635 [Acidobacteria bacterium]|nr:hypothetical protein [Acidobacteriota bacterium]
MKRTWITLTLAVVVPVLAWGGFAGTEVYLPSVGLGPGYQGSHWHTSLWIENPGTVDANVTFEFLARGTSNPAPPVAHLVVPPGETIRIVDVLADLFAMSKGYGALRITADHEVLVAARAFSQPQGAGDDLSTGQFFGAVPASFAIGLGDATGVVGGFQFTPMDSGPFRYNYGFVETTGNNATVRVTAFNGNDPTTSIGSKDYTVGGYAAIQDNLSKLIPNPNGDNIYLRFEVISGSGKIIAFGTGIANGSNDPSTFEMQFADSLLSGGGGGGGGLTSVAHDTTLTGDGTSGAPLGIADGGVTPAKLSAAGSAAGQVLTSDGTHVSWQTPSGGGGGGGGLSLPYSGTSAANAIAFAVHSSADFPTVEGENNGTGSNPVGVFGRADHGTGVEGHGNIGISGESTGTGFGVVGAIDNGSSILTVGPVGVVGSAANGAGVVGLSDTNYGVDGISTSGPGVHGYSSAHDGVRGHSAGASKSGVYGFNENSKGYGVYGRNSANGATGFLGGTAVVNGGLAEATGVAGTATATNGTGVLGVADNGSDAYGVWGVSSGGYAGYFSGKVHIEGNLEVSGSVSKGGGSFKIDHPLDPANKYLYHSFVESPDMMDIYNGNVRTDGDGYAVVELPGYFQALNRDFRYQLTVIGQFAQAIVAEEIHDNRFVIRTNLGNVRVSWQVTGIRHDPWANAHRIQVEVPKPPSERGTYLEPALYGQGPEHALSARVAKLYRAKAKHAEAGR